MRRTQSSKSVIPLTSGGSFTLKTAPKRLMLLAAALAILLPGCGTGSAEAAYTKHRGEFYDTFDTMVIVVAYTKTKEEFDGMFETVHEMFIKMHRLFDIYHDYEVINNIKTINDSAGVKAVKVDERIIDMLGMAKDWCVATGGKVNIAMGPVLKIWHDYREAGTDDPGAAQLPPMDALLNASRNIGIDDVIIDKEASTVYLKRRGMSLDVGAVAKGYAAQAAADELKRLGYDSVLISAGGNVCAVGSPRDGKRSQWGVGIKDPDSPLEWSAAEENLLDVAFVSDMSVVSSGGYERFYTVDGRQYCHLIDPDTLMPAQYYKAVTVITEDSAEADILSTALFLMPPEESMRYAKSIGAEALWVMPDGEIAVTPGMKAMLRDMGGASYE